MDAELVALQRTTTTDLQGTVEKGSVRHFVFPGPSLALGINAKTPEVQGNKRSHFPFCFPVNLMGPNSIFVL